MTIRIIPLTGIPEVLSGADLPSLLKRSLSTADQKIEAGDILVVTQKIVSKAEGRWVTLASISPGAEASRLAEITRKDPRLVQLILDESVSVVRAVPNVLIVRTRHGLVMANAGIDQSNVGPGGPGRALLLPLDPDGSAERLAEQLGCAVLISDSFGRPWRLGVTAVGIGAARLPALLDQRGAFDRDGRELAVTQIAVADLLASAACLATGEGNEGIPAVLIRGYRTNGPCRPAADLIRSPGEDLFL